MGADLVVFDDELGDHDPGREQGVEELAVELVVPQEVGLPWGSTNAGVPSPSSTYAIDRWAAGVCRAWPALADPNPLDLADHDRVVARSETGRVSTLADRRQPARFALLVGSPFSQDRPTSFAGLEPVAIGDDPFLRQHAAAEATEAGAL